MASLKLYHFILSTFSRKVRVAMAEKGIVCDKIIVDLMKGEQHNPDYLKLNPHGRVPTLLVDGAPIYESTAIIEYLEEVHPAPPLLPREPLARARARMIEEVIDGYLIPAARQVMVNTQLKPPAERDEKAAEEGRKSCAFHNQWLDQELSGRQFLAGSAPSVADIAALCALELQVARAGFEIDPKNRNLLGWRDRMRARPSAKALNE